MPPSSGSTPARSCGCGRQAGLLRVEASVPEGGDADRFAQVVKDHLERFGQREELDVVWADPVGQRHARLARRDRVRLRRSSTAAAG